MSLATKTIVSHRSESGHPEAALNSSVLDRMMDAMTSPFLNGRRAESIKNGRKVHPGAFVFSLIFLISLSLTSFSNETGKDCYLSYNSSITTQEYL